MKFPSILAAASLALAPAVASAGSSGDSTDSTANSRPISGPLAAQPMDDKIPAGAVILLGFVVLGGAIIAIMSSDSNVDTNVDTNNGTN